LIFYDFVAVAIASNVMQHSTEKVVYNKSSIRNKVIPLTRIEQTFNILKNETHSEPLLKLDGFRKKFCFSHVKILF